MTRNPDVPCSRCGALGWRPKRPALSPRVCRACRRVLGLPLIGRPAATEVKSEV